MPKNQSVLKEKKSRLKKIIRQEAGGSMNIRNVLLCVISLHVIVLAGSAFAVQDENIPANTEYDLSACVMRGLQANPALVATRHALESSAYDCAAAFSSMLPKFTASYGYTYQARGAKGDLKGLYAQDLWASTLKVTQPLLPGLALLSGFQKSMLAKEAYTARVEQVELALVQAIQSTFFAVLKGRMDVKSAEDAVERLKSQLKVTTAFYEVGLQPRLDVLQAEVDIASARQSLLSAQNALATQETQLNALLDLPLDADIRYIGILSEREFTMDLKECLTQAYAQRPDVLIGSKTVAMAGKDLNIAVADLLPSFVARWDYTKLGNTAGLKADLEDWTVGQQEYWTAGIQAEYALELGMGDISETLSAKEAYKQTVAELENTKLNAGFEVKQAYLNIRAAYDRIQVARKQVEASQEAYRMAVARYQAQVGTNTDVLNAQADVSSSEAQLNTALSDYLTALSTLYVAMGVKNPGLELQ